jgi:hypothetical protein
MLFTLPLSSAVSRRAAPARNTLNYQIRELGIEVKK